MCGILGTYPHQDHAFIENGIAKIKHRGPDDDAVVQMSNGAFGHTRLSIIDVENGAQPMAHRDAWIVFNGEIYNFQKIKKLIPGAMNTDSDTEVVLHLYRLLGPDSISLLDGMFAFAIADQDSLFLARDPLGIKPLYYAIRDKTMYFASEIKALAELSVEVKAFPAGHWWHSEFGLNQFYSLERENFIEQQLASGSVEDGVSAIREKLQAAVEKRMIADPEVAVGVSLSGGLDSSVVAALARNVKHDLNTFVVGIEGSADLAASFQVAEHLGTRHHAYQYAFEEMADALPEVIYHLESFDAALIRSAIPNYFLAKLASEHVKVILTGEGADELYAGYDYLEPVSDPDYLQSELLTITGSLHNTNLQRADRMSMAYGLEARVPFLDKAFVDYSLALPPEWKLRTNGWTEKELLRRAFEGMVPAHILNRPKKKFSDGAGSIDLLAAYANQRISDEEFGNHISDPENEFVRSKEELYYLQIFRSLFGDRLSPNLVGRTRSVTEDELS